MFIYLNELANSAELTNALAYTLRLSYDIANQHTDLLGKHGRLAVRPGTRAECLAAKNWVWIFFVVVVIKNSYLYFN